MERFICNIFDFFKKEMIFSISLILAIISCFFVKPNGNYLNYINWDTIILLFLIMIIVEILKNLSVFELFLCKLLSMIGNTRQLVFVLVFTCFFSSIFITNDVSLIIFVPFSILAFKKINKTDLLVWTISLQTIAANIGCMVLPIGAPHNIVMYTISKIPFVSFLLLLLPYVIVSVGFLLILIFIVPNHDINMFSINKKGFHRKNFFKKVFLGVDYLLLLTFIVLFILIGNLENIPFLKSLFANCFLGNEVLMGVSLSQIISNVPAAILLSGFSANYEAIIVGINIGGFGTLIASMANLISYKILVREFTVFKKRYLIVFTLLNIMLLIILMCVYFMI